MKGSKLEDRAPDTFRDKRNKKSYVPEAGDEEPRRKVWPVDRKLHLLTRELSSESWLLESMKSLDSFVTRASENQRRGWVI